MAFCFTNEEGSWYPSSSRQVPFFHLRTHRQVTFHACQVMNSFHPKCHFYLQVRGVTTLFCCNSATLFCVITSHCVFIFPDRYYWSNYDPVICAEGLFAIANVLDFTRFASLLPAFEALGTLQISFGYMIKVRVAYCQCPFVLYYLFILIYLIVVMPYLRIYHYHNRIATIKPSNVPAL